MEPDSEALRGFIRDIDDFPVPGVKFRDITPLLADGGAWRTTVLLLAERVGRLDVDRVAGIEARGFMLGAAVASELGVGFVPIRKSGKLPWKTTAVTYDLEYGQDTLEVHVDSAAPGDRIAIVDDVLATGGTAAAAADLMSATGARVAGLVFLIELAFLEGRRRLAGHNIEALLHY
jgi:adenine phosphoribosyltransferase